MIVKRVIDLIGAVIGLLLLSPIFLFLVIWVRSDSPGPVFFRQQRVGRFAKPFYILKFRTMVSDAASKGAAITIGNDHRITRSGAFIRRYKLDELPQLWNVIKGEMSLVGPRPEVPEYVQHWPVATRDTVLSVRPGMTDFASIEFRHEAELLARAEDPIKTYVEEITPIKLDYYNKYVQDRTLMMDLRILWLTVKVVLGR